MIRTNDPGPSVVPGGASSRLSDATVGESLAVTLFRVAWLAILLGMAIEILLLLAAVAFGADAGTRTVAAELVKLVAWSFLVCLGLAIGTSVADALKAAPALFGLLITPVAFSIARGLHRGASQLLGGIQRPPDIIHPVALAALRGVEYCCLGMLVAWVGGHPPTSAGGYIAVGSITGLVFGAVVLTLRSLTTPAGLSPAAVAALIVNEVLFPIGCAFVLYLARVIKRHASSYAAFAR